MPAAGSVKLVIVAIVGAALVLSAVTTMGMSRRGGLPSPSSPLSLPEQLGASLPEPSVIPGGWKVFASSTYRMSLRYPPHWREGSDPDRYEGDDGFFSLSAESGGGLLSIDELAREDAYHKLQPYGSRPQIEATRVQGQEARFIFPSADQFAEMRREAALVVRYPREVEIGSGLPHLLQRTMLVKQRPSRPGQKAGDTEEIRNSRWGSERYEFFALRADLGHIRDIAQTIRFFP